MDRRRVLEMFIMGLWLMIAVVIGIKYSRNYQNATPLPEMLATPFIPESQKDKEYQVSKIIVLRGDTFDITLEDNDFNRVLGKLDVLATDNSKEKVLDFLNHATSPKIILREKQVDGRWTIDLFVEKDGEKINLSKWLSNNNLVYK